MSRPIDADALKAKCGTWYTEEGTEEGFIGTLGSLLDDAPTIDAIPVEWLRQKAEENSRYAEPYFAFAYVLHEWQQTKSIEELQAESEMRDWKAEQELDT